MLPLSGTGAPLVREAVERVASLASEVFVLTEQRQVRQIRSLVPGLDQAHVIAEPAARGTTNALGLAALTLVERDSEAVMVSLAADHVIRGLPAFRAAIRQAAELAARSRQLVTVGLKPRYPATGFGYIEAGERLQLGRRTAFRVRRFVEKPDAKTAATFLADGRHYWNLAMFCWRCDAFLDELKRYGPRHYNGLQRVLAARRRGDEAEAARIYARLPVDAVDYTVMEKSDRLLVLPASFDWVDVGSWSDLADLLTQDAAGNVVDGEPILIDTRRSFISVPDKLVAVIGMEDLVVVDTPDALLVCPKSRAQDVKKVVEALRRAGKTQYL